MIDPAEATRQRFEYRPHLDGLRTVAVFMVVLFHSGVAWMSGGFVGVDVFFVLSGFLVTSILLKELGRNGRVRFRRFYARRARRLLPAAFLALSAVTIALRLFATPFEQAQRAPDIVSAALYFSNWRFIAESTDYFGSDILASPVLHFWSLSIEEQFYLAWPLLLTGLFLVAHRSRFNHQRMLVASLAVLASLSILLMIVLSESNPQRAYFGTGARAYQLLFGGLIAVWIFRRERKNDQVRTRVFVGFGAPVALVGLIIVSTSTFALAPTIRGLWAAFFAGSLIVLLEFDRSGGINGILAWRPMTALGKISYGIYLWHWPLVIAIVRADVFEPSARWLVVGVASSAIAAVSYFAVERPIVRSTSLSVRPLRVIGAGAALSAGSAIAAIVLLTPSGSGSEGVDWQAAAEDTVAHVSCTDGDVADCVLVEGSGLHIMIVGDSLAAHWIPAFLSLAEDENMTVSASTRGSCPWPDVVSERGGSIDEHCSRFRDDLLDRVIPELHPDLVVAVGGSVERRPIYVDGELLESGDPRRTEAMTAGATRTLDRMAPNARL